MLCVVSPYGFVCVCVWLSKWRERGKALKGVGGWVGGRGRGRIFKGKKGCAHVWCTASDKQYMTSMSKTVSPLWFEMNIRHYMLKTSICVCARVNPGFVYVSMFSFWVDMAFLVYDLPQAGSSAHAMHSGLSGPTLWHSRWGRHSLKYRERKTER